MKNSDAAKAWPRAVVIGKLSRKADESVRRQCLDDEHPWLILTPSGFAGTLAAFDDRLAIIKTGAGTSLLAGALGGERAATFHYVDITGVEYNSGMLNGVLEILTASYSGASNKDFWRGATKGRNSNSDDPYTLSNTLPLAKIEYKQAATAIQELRRRVGAAKARPSNQHAGGDSDDLSAQLRRLAELHESGALTADEFATAKARLIG